MQTTLLEAFTSMFHTAAQKKTNMLTQDQTNFQTKVVRCQKATLFIISIKIPMPKPRWTGFAPTAQAGLSRINQSLEAFVYCVLGSQVNVRSSKLGSGRRAKEAQSEFLVLVEDAIRQPDLAPSVQRYKLAVDEAKMRLNLAVCPGAWLMPGQVMVIDTESVVGYNQLKQARAGMKLGINNEVNKGPSTHGRGKIKNKPAKQPYVKPDSQGRNKRKKAGGSNSGRTNARCPNTT